MNTLIDDYTRYHVVLVIAGGILLLIFILLSIFFWTQFRRTPRGDTHKWSFEKKVYASFGALCIIVGLLIALVTAANASNALNPRHGFSLLVDSLGTPGGGTQMAALYRAFNAWIQSGSDNMPSIIQGRVHDRIALNTIRAIFSGVLLIGFVALSTGIWGTLVRKSRVRESGWGLKERALLVSGVATIALSLVLMVIAERNMQGAFAPITLVLLYG